MNNSGHSSNSIALVAKSGDNLNLSSDSHNDKVESHALDQYVCTKLCPAVLQGRRCRQMLCLFAHSESELRELPNLRKTRLCADFKKNGTCELGDDCEYAHGDDDLRHTDAFYKTKMCKYWPKHCSMGKLCRHAHGEKELRPAPEFLIHKQVGFKSSLLESNILSAAIRRTAEALENGGDISKSRLLPQGVLPDFDLSDPSDFAAALAALQAADPTGTKVLKCLLPNFDESRANVELTPEQEAAIASMSESWNPSAIDFVPSTSLDEADGASPPLFLLDMHEHALLRVSSSQGDEHEDNSSKQNSKRSNNFVNNRRPHFNNNNSSNHAAGKRSSSGNAPKPKLPSLTDESFYPALGSVITSNTAKKEVDTGARIASTTGSSPSIEVPFEDLLANLPILVKDKKQQKKSISNNTNNVNNSSESNKTKQQPVKKQEEEEYYDYAAEEARKLAREAEIEAQMASIKEAAVARARESLRKEAIRLAQEAEKAEELRIKNEQKSAEEAIRKAKEEDERRIAAEKAERERIEREAKERETRAKKALEDAQIAAQKAKEKAENDKAAAQQAKEAAQKAAEEAARIAEARARERQQALDRKAALRAEAERNRVAEAKRLAEEAKEALREKERMAAQLAAEEEERRKIKEAERMRIAAAVEETRKKIKQQKQLTVISEDSGTLNAGSAPTALSNTVKKAISARQVSIGSAGFGLLGNFIKKAAYNM